MGILNDITTTKLDSYAINIYCIVSALFFSACGYAQLNDPLPYSVFWFLAYIVGGTVPNLYWITRSNCTNNGNSNGGSNGGSSTSTYNSKQRYVLQLLLFYGFTSIMILCILYKMITVAPKLFADDVTQHHYGIVWAFMEHEEGRDSCGLLLLILHVLYMNTVLSRTTDPTQSSRRNSETSTTTYKRFISIVCSPTIVSIFLLMVLGISIYTWIVHHPEMVAKYGVPHCQGTMFGREDNNEL
ncbi:hypothetical protein FRACYDRAFT_264742 [Fragilariopsis cylindrus CCMP1102]|uniref:Uncharacterized protein n=1 Tax=Fragilariopsis cylindrus CCMP1102 TaxID=635003 RepID=A0A1E7EQE1_9STRA|nr:hypothetical protein FRACYDRAFT_264742 [Fragilariopsis cylindrus CCMP1102]|eukprot:OEU08129.1 hypothetical protein FRACYDRAFT_264742 [Fragilariopsis cylindrus CCMP1102]